MSILDVVSLFGGVALFLYGMTVMGNGLEKLAGGKTEKALEKMTGNILTSVALGAIVTALIQSSSGTTVIVVGLVNAGILQLRQAVGVIMGANIGTTITAQIIRLSDIQGDSLLLQLLKPKALAPMAATVGIILFLVAKRSRKKEIGQMLLGFGILFMGMFAMEAAVSPLQDSPVFMQFLAAMSNPVLGVLAGAVVTATIQSSAASIGMLQAISSTGILAFSTAFPIIMGQNIGTCITPILASIGASKNAKRSALIHLYFNILGTVLFLLATYGLIAVFGAPKLWTEPVGRTGIANFHTSFNIIVTLVLIPFAGLLERLARSSIKDAREEREDVANLLDERFLKSPSIALQQVDHVIGRMTELATENLHAAMRLIVKYDRKAAERLEESEDTIDRLEDKLEHYLIKLSSGSVSAQESRYITEIMHLMKDYERIGDYATNLSECALEMEQHGVVFTPQAMEEVRVLNEAVCEIVGLANNAYFSMSRDAAKRIEPLEETVDAIVAKLKDMHVARLKSGLCNVHAGIVFLEILTNLERVADHCSNIAIHVLSIVEGKDRYAAHEYVKRAHEMPDAGFSADFEMYMNKYFTPINQQHG